MNVSPALRAYLLDPLERALSTFLQQLFVVLLATGSASVVSDRTHWEAALVSSAFAAAISILTTYGQMAFARDLTPRTDLALRVVKTFAQSMLGILLASSATTFVTADWKSALATAIPVTLIAALKGFVALSLPGTAGASLLPAEPQPEVQPGIDADPTPNSPTAEPPAPPIDVPPAVQDDVTPATQDQGVPATAPVTPGA